MLLTRFLRVSLNEITVTDLLFAFLSFGPLYLGILGFDLRTVPSTLNFCIFNLRRPSGGLFIFFIRFIQIFIGVLFSYYKTNEKRNKWTLITQLKYD